MKTNNEEKVIWANMSEEKQDDIIHNYTEGLVIFSLSKHNNWIDNSEWAMSQGGIYAIEVKPEPKYRPYKDVSEVPLGTNMVRKKEWASGERTSIDRIFKECVNIRSEHSIQYRHLFQDWEHEDGTPFGVKTDE